MSKMFFLVSVALTAMHLCVIYGDINAATPPIDKPDMDVTFISQTPRYPSIHGKVDYLDHSKPFLTKPEYADIKKFFPEKGEKITFTAHFMNKGAQIDGETDFVWKINGKEEVIEKVKMDDLVLSDDVIVVPESFF